MKGKLIVLDGNDGSGKATQTKLLADWLNKEGFLVEVIDFPRYYDNAFGALIGECLRGEHGDFIGLDPKIASTLYAVDRFESKEKIQTWLNQGRIVLCDRYATANMIHQGGKIIDDEERISFVTWLENMEFVIFKIPRPDLVLYLDVPVSISLQNLSGKKESYTKNEKDQHEANESFLENSRKTANWLLGRNLNWNLIECSDGVKMHSLETINVDIITQVKKII